MNSVFINRLVGTSIVVVAAVIFIPNILDGEKVHYKEGFQAIPERPEFKTIDLQEKVDAQAKLAPELPSEPLEDIDADDAKLEGTEETTLANTQQSDTSPTHVEAKPVATTDKVEVAKLTRPETANFSKMAYVIQLGSFSHKSNVDALTKKLADNGFKTFTKPVKTPNGTLTKVFVGPALNKAELEAKLPELKKLTKLNGRLTQFEVTK
ncbi:MULTISPECIES: SPOR domain-containing protein [Pseudoalteromonas]|uniref:SPOR domain-containing protein n=1 Tax=Pseudoalteromonas maricaloris TaxID=184924 RepID=A0A8I2H1M6_9GAMM|nr:MULTISPECIES: SPOR domain-containing protein [Pseudoalteromonas]MCG7538520.1 SPOR domain-containing protein [Pseudoalteromonas sp. OF7H-1]KID38223.1 DedD protein [Pseudoalteromonas flavipulchra NCIMB 2033 = ATCC BAA-314]MBD0782595.1 SPOR domain-containing protein [Pseudoalteromonas flavipulchra]MBE0372178.1 DedD protein [Pseudoalteromonas flavipulchra NCIMB 2033 = ATCC BAA-314]NLR20695.1 SPOR domain-containing protein [Pseudoalteromonas maricaloris]